MNILDGKKWTGTEYLHFIEVNDEELNLLIIRDEILKQKRLLDESIKLIGQCKVVSSEIPSDEPTIFASTSDPEEDLMKKKTILRKATKRTTKTTTKAKAKRGPGRPAGSKNKTK